MTDQTADAAPYDTDATRLLVTVNWNGGYYTPGERAKVVDHWIRQALDDRDDSPAVVIEPEPAEVEQLRAELDKAHRECDKVRDDLEQAKRQALTEASGLLWAWAEEMGDVGGTGPRAVRKRTIKACARKIAPEPTDDEMRAALAELLGGMADRAKADTAAPGSPRRAQEVERQQADAQEPLQRANLAARRTEMTTDATQTSYARAALDALAAELPGEDLTLLRLYTLLVLTKGRSTTLGDVHDAWALWRLDTRPDHPSLVPFDELSHEVQELDRPYMEAIHRAADALPKEETP